ncbi:hypothetical protein HN588_12595 [Candidatus Bathyarchaeota archaeon]|jgi:hypothetical protein|nr:hypothetical protein [Candidatus Bathyarchaeota archaeon]
MSEDPYATTSNEEVKADESRSVRRQKWLRIQGFLNSNWWAAFNLGGFLALVIGFLPVILWKLFGIGLCRGWFSPMDEFTIHLGLVFIVYFLLLIKSHKGLANYLAEHGEEIRADLGLD